jgi:hypothetical protein
MLTLEKMFLLVIYMQIRSEFLESTQCITKMELELHRFHEQYIS